MLFRRCKPGAVDGSPSGRAPGASRWDGAAWNAPISDHAAFGRCVRAGGENEAVEEAAPHTHVAQAGAAGHRSELGGRERALYGKRPVVPCQPVACPERVGKERRTGIVLPVPLQVVDDYGARHAAELPQHLNRGVVLEVMERERHHGDVVCAVAERKGEGVAADERCAGSAAQPFLRERNDLGVEIERGDTNVTAALRHVRGKRRVDVAGPAANVQNRTGAGAWQQTLHGTDRSARASQETVHIRNLLQAPAELRLVVAGFIQVLCNAREPFLHDPARAAATRSAIRSMRSRTASTSIVVWPGFAEERVPVGPFSSPTACASPLQERYSTRPRTTVSTMSLPRAARTSAALMSCAGCA